MTLSPVDPAALLRPLLLFVGLLIVFSAPESEDNGHALAGAAGCLGVGAAGAKAAKGCGSLGKTASLASKAGTAAKATAVGAAGAHLVDDAARVGAAATAVGDDAARIGLTAAEAGDDAARSAAGLTDEVSVQTADEGAKADDLIDPAIDLGMELIPEEEEDAP